MDRLAKKCVIASSIMHGSLVLVLLAVPAFFWGSAVPLHQEEVIVITPANKLEASRAGSDNLDVPRTPPTPEPKPNAEPNTAEPVSKRGRKIEVNLTPTTRGVADVNTLRGNDNASSKDYETAISHINSRASAPLQLRDFRGSDAATSYPGFSDALISEYWRVWLIPAEAAGEASKVVVTVTLRRDGTVISSRIHTRSGNSALDASVQRALDKVTFIAPLPESVKDAQKTFRLEFDPKAKRMMG